MQESLRLREAFRWHRCGAYVVEDIAATIYPPGLCRVVKEPRWISTGIQGMSEQGFWRIARHSPMPATDC